MAAPSATVSSKGQLVIPAEIRKKLRIKGRNPCCRERTRWTDHSQLQTRMKHFWLFEGVLSHVKEDVERPDEWKSVGEMREREESKYREMQ